MSELLHRLDLAALGERLRSGTLTVRALTDHVLSRAEALDPALHAYVAIGRDAAMARAEALDRARPPAGQMLWGIPLAHKDMFARPGRQPQCGLAKPTGAADLPPSPVLAALDAAGTVDLGPLALAEFALGITGTNDTFGNAGNPWDPARCSGASSSGSAVAVAAGMALGSLGTDTGASVRVPASFCGIVGLKPTLGALDTTGVFPSSWAIDTVGVLARHVEDCALIFDTARGVVPCRVADAGSLTIGIPDRYYTEHACAEVAAAWDAARAVLTRAGHRVVEIPVIETVEIRALMRLVSRTEASAVHRALIQQHPDHYPLSVRKFLSGGEGVLAIDYVDALRLRGTLLRQAMETTFSHVDALLTPTTPYLPPAYADISDSANSSVWQVVSMLAHYTQPASFLGLPALSVPFTVSGERLPIGLQLVGAPWSEAKLFRAALPLQQHWREQDFWPDGT